MLIYVVSHSVVQVSHRICCEWIVQKISQKNTVLLGCFIDVHPTSWIELLMHVSWDITLVYLFGTLCFVALCYVDVDHSVNNRPVKRLASVTRLPSAFYIVPHAGWNYGIVTPFLSASLYFSKRGAYWDRLCRDVVGWSLVGWLSRACTVAKRCILGL